jgi:C4-dicarboxylate-specific signal transduction histidine kinase
MVAVLQDIFVAVALLTITVGLVLPGMIAHSAVEVMEAAKRLATGTLSDFSLAMEALAAGNLDDAHARVNITPVRVHTRDEVGQMAASFNTMQEEVKRAAVGLDGAREGLRRARRQLQESNATLERRVVERTSELKAAHSKLVDVARQAGMAEVATGVLHNVGNVLNSVNVSSALIGKTLRKRRVSGLAKIAALLGEHKADLAGFMTTDSRGIMLPGFLAQLAGHLAAEQESILKELEHLQKNIEHIKEIVNAQQSNAASAGVVERLDLPAMLESVLRMSGASLTRHKISVTREFRDIGPVLADKHKVLQILVNLITNARQAMHGQPTRTLSLGIQGHDAVALISIGDTGCGIPSENMTRIFAHGFTTKSGGHGFGLHTSALAAQEMNGALTAQSAGPGKGATFTLELPTTASLPLAA